MILALPQEIRKLIYDMVIELERKEGVLSSWRWLQYRTLLLPPSRPTGPCIDRN